MWTDGGVLSGPTLPIPLTFAAESHQDVTREPPLLSHSTWAHGGALCLLFCSFSPLSGTSQALSRALQPPASAAASLTLTALPISQCPVPAGAGTAVGARGIHTGVHAEPGASLLPVEFAFIHIWGQKCPV